MIISKLYYSQAVLQAVGSILYENKSFQCHLYLNNARMLAFGNTKRSNHSKLN